MKCNRCDAKREDVYALVTIKGDSVLCSDCVKLMYNKLKDAIGEDFTNTVSKVTEACVEEDSGTHLPSVKKIVEHLDQYVIGQTNAKQTIAVAVRNHYKRLHMTEEDQMNSPKSNIIINGQSGTGKTEIVRRLCTYLDVPVVIVDATSYTSAGYTGGDVEDMVKKLYHESGKNVRKTETGIIFIDEIDKKRKGASSGNGKDVAGEEVQKALLKLVEGSKVEVTKGVTIDTKNILFIAAGAFVGIDKIIKDRIKKETGGSVGFFSTSVDEDTIEDKVTTEDFNKFGMILELLGRFPVITTTNELTEDQLVSVITTTKSSTYKYHKRLFEMDGVDLCVDDDVIRLLARKAKKDKIGVRGVHKYFDEVLKEHMYKLEDYAEDNVNKVKISLDSNGNLKHKITKKRVKKSK